MSTQTATMNDFYSLPARFFGFFRKLIVFLSFVVGIVAFMVLFDFYQTHLSVTMMTIFAVTSISLAVGLGSRVTFYEFSGYVRYTAALITLPIALFVVGLFTNWRIGIGPFEPWLKGIVDWFQLAQLGGGLFVSLLALWAWWRPAERTAEEILPEVRERPRQQARVTSSSQRARFKLPRINPPRLHLPDSWTQPRGNSRLRVNHNHRSSAQNRNHRQGVDRLVVRRPEKPVRPKRRRSSRRKPELQFSSFEEHRCPYCLDEVKRNDPRGVKECEVCHSLHHADCWNITGMCQVPHLNS